MTGKLFCLLSVPLILFACSREQGQELPLTNNEILDSMLQEAPYSIVDLDGISVDTLVVGRSDLLGLRSDENLDTPDSSAFLTSVHGFVKSGDNLIIADDRQLKIVVMNLNGEIVRTGF